MTRQRRDKFSIEEKKTAVDKRIGNIARKSMFVVTLFLGVSLFITAVVFVHSVIVFSPIEMVKKFIIFVALTLAFRAVSVRHYDLAERYPKE